jgi:hypothetical protein
MLMLSGSVRTSEGERQRAARDLEREARNGNRTKP